MIQLNNEFERQAWFKIFEKALRASSKTDIAWSAEYADTAIEAYRQRIVQEKDTDGWEAVEDLLSTITTIKMYSKNSQAIKCICEEAIEKWQKRPEGI